MPSRPENHLPVITHVSYQAAMQPSLLLRACSRAERVANAISAASRRLYTDWPSAPSLAPSCVPGQQARVKHCHVAHNRRRTTQMWNTKRP